MSNSRQTERLLWWSTRTRRRISAQFSMWMNTHRPHGSGTLAGDTHPHRGPQVVSKAMGAPFSDRPPVTGPRYVFSPAVTRGLAIAAVTRITRAKGREERWVVP